MNLTKKLFRSAALGALLTLLCVVSASAENLGVGTVTADALRLRGEAEAESSILATASKDEVVVVLEEVDEIWYKVDYVTPVTEQLVEYAKQFLGVPYVWGGNGPKSFDCSGFTKYVYAHFGYGLNRTASAQMSNGVKVSLEELQPGDLVFFNNGRVRTSASHVGMYIGDGQFIHASTNHYNVEISNLSGYYLNIYIGARRIVNN